MSDWVNLAEGLDVLDKYWEMISVGNTLGFRNEETKEIERYKVIRVDRKRGKVWAKPVHLYDLDEPLPEGITMRAEQ